MTTVEEVEHNTYVARRFVPMTAEEQDTLLERVRPLAADGRFEYYKSTQLNDSVVQREQHGFPPPGSYHGEESA